MRTLFFIAMIFVSTTISAQIPDFNTKIKSDRSESISKSSDTLMRLYDRLEIAVPIPVELLADMETLMNIQEKEIGAVAADKLRIFANDKVTEYQDKRDSLKISRNSEGLPSENYNRDILEYSDKIKRYKILRSFFSTANSLGGTPGWSRRVIPVRNLMNAKYFFLYNNDEESVMFIDKIGIQSNFSSSYSANANLISGVLPPFLKFTMATNIAQQTSATDSIAVAKLPEGGLLNAGVLIPLFFSKSYVGNGKRVIFYLPIEYRFNIDNLRDKVSLSDTYNYHQVSSFLMATFDLLQKDGADAATLFGALKGTYFWGGSNFSNRLSANYFKTLHFTVGLQVQNKYTLSASIPFWSDNDLIRNQQIATFGVTFQPAKKD